MNNVNQKHIDLFVCGSSHASGVGRGSENYNKMHDQKSWVGYFADGELCDNVWNISLPGRPLGLTTADVAEFCWSYYKKYGNYDKLFVMIELTFPNYKHWDPVAMARNDTTELVLPVTYIRMYNSTDKNIRNPIKISSDQNEMRYIEKKFYKRTDVNFLDHKFHRHDNIYQEVHHNDVNSEQLQKLDQDIKQWFEYDYHDQELGEKFWSEQKSHKFLRYAADEIYTLQRNLEHGNVPYLMFWVGSGRGGKSNFMRKVDRIFKPIIQTKRMIPMSKFTMMEATNKLSKKPWRGHPDDIGHQKIAEYLLKWVHDNKLKQRPQSNLVTSSWGDNKS